MKKIYVTPVTDVTIFTEEEIRTSVFESVETPSSVVPGSNFNDLF